LSFDDWAEEVVTHYAGLTNGQPEWARQVLELQQNGLKQWFDAGIEPADAARKAADHNLERPRRRRRSRCGGR
jgi:hypothetical protein